MSLMKYSGFVGFVVYAAMTLVLSADIPPPECSDGWQSPSIGRQGACSHHGGVNYHDDLYFRAVGIGALSGLLVYVIGTLIERRVNSLNVPDIDPNTLGPTEVILHAIKHKLAIEFTYLRPGSPETTRSLVPTDLSHVSQKGNYAVLYVTGLCELRQEQRTFAMSRIKDVRIPGSNNSFKPRPLHGSA